MKPDTLKYSIAGAGLNKMIAVDMESYFYETDDFGVSAEYKFKDIEGRNIEISISENNPKGRKPFGLLAPMGDAAVNPSSLPLIMLHDFYFVRKNKTAIQILINEKSHKPDNLPMRIDWQKMTFVRYSPKPLVVTLNPEYSGFFQGFQTQKGQEVYQKGDYIYEIEWLDQTPFIKSMSTHNSVHLLSMTFSPPFQCLNTIPVHSEVQGRFTISGHESIGRISGEYFIQSNKETMQVRIVPSKGWKPKVTKFSTRFLFSAAKVFKKWPGTYQWDAELHKNQEDLWYMQSKWSRTGSILKY